MSQTQANLVEVRGIRFSRGDRVIFDDISLSVPRGKITAIMGPSGIGKTTLLRLIGGQIPPDRGEILFDGENVPQMTRSRLYTVRKRMSMLFQSGALFTDLNVFDNVAYPLREHTQLPPALLHTTVMMKLEAVGLRGAAKLMPSELSGGMARRAALARAIALEPDLITYVTDRLGHDMRYAIDSTKLQKELGWEPSLQFEEGIEKTVRWYLDNQEWMDNVTSGDYQKYYDSMYKGR